MAGGREFDRERFRELILHIADQSRDDPRFGISKLNKILYFTDFKSFGILGRSMTGATYARMDHGPVPREMLATLRELEDAGDITRVERRYLNQQQKVVLPSRTSRADELFEDREIEIVSIILAELRVRDAEQVAVLSSLDQAWRLSDYDEEIPYEMAFISFRKPTPTELRIWREDIDERRRQRAG